MGQTTPHSFRWSYFCGSNTACSFSANKVSWGGLKSGLAGGGGGGAGTGIAGFSGESAGIVGDMGIYQQQSENLVCRTQRQLAARHSA